jgi:aminoglycoside phosphotransferase (APT) family kinase protein
MIVRLPAAPPVAAPLLDLLRAPLGVRDLYYAQAPDLIPDSWETDVYRFQLHSRQGLLPAFAGPLILRVFSNHHGPQRLRHESQVQRHVQALGYPVPEVLLAETAEDLFGAPFLIMKQIPGHTLLDDLLHHPWRIFTGPALLAEMHTRLHQLPTGGFPTPSGPFLARHLEQMRAQMEEHDLPGLKPGLAWLEANDPGPVEAPSIVHLDFHPINVMVHHGRCQGVLDWGDADMGDRHADVAVTLILIRSVAVKVAPLWQRLSIAPGRPALYHGYRWAYRQRLPLDKRRLSYYLAWAALRRLCRYGVCLRAGPQRTGYKPAALQFLTADRIDILRRCFGEPTRVEVRL